MFCNIYRHSDYEKQLESESYGFEVSRNWRQQEISEY